MVRMSIFTVIAAVFLLVACAQEPTKETIGTGAGAVLGGVIGSEVGDGTAGTVVGGVLGAVLGREVGRRLDARDEEQAAQALENNQTVSWTDRETGDQYTVNPTDTFERDGRVCRRYTTTVSIEGEPQTASGTACKRDDGTWEVID
ncbi:RT0821/Lpp0805 family surface protein [Thiohalomonas denitrificans]|uniref:RT0821/Lpp0805 family surface protein n=1 Tax=Thiohalomonas denitrificans TaxID=415747 RepID=UPI0026F1CD44|nr:RT0821/Lpp0805 family surface protein [Thiohalomonas denitrificans]